MKAPDFWAKRDRPRTALERAGATARDVVLAPAAAAFSIGGRVRRSFVREATLDAPVICVGNLVAGGAGKTPTALALCDRLRARGLSPHVLSRGYGGRLRGPHRVNPAVDRASDVGDEPLLMARRVPVWIGRDRVATGEAAIYEGADILVLDDGYQNPRLRKDLSFVVIDTIYGHGNGRVVPAGPLREPLEAGFSRAQAAVLVGERPADGVWPWTPPGLIVLRARVAPAPHAAAWREGPLLAFAGIGRPEKFFDMLRRLGADVADVEAFPDHHPYSPAIMARLEARAQELGARLATTEKDAERVPAAYRERVLTVPVELGFADPDALDRVLAPAIALARRRAPARL